MQTAVHSPAMPPRTHPGLAVPANASQLLAALPQPIFVVRPDRRLLLCNRSAERLLRDHRAEVNAGHLMQIGQMDATRLQGPLRLAQAGSTSCVGLWFAPGISTGWLHSTPLPPDLVTSTGWPDDAVLLVIHLDQPALTQAARIDALARHSRLSAAERHVLMLLGDGMTVEASAQQLGVCLSTLRSHVRNLLGKTQASSLMQLLRWVGSGQALPH
ncbi:MAG: helix-turn-helix transcriptional regulator [Methylotenera sp.]|jgi:DNA-binding CsgD family transcriptional regulator|nr:helix-turn-helix transcriptional regulator [Methylotenera sp.]